MAYSDDDIRELYLETDKFLIDGDKFNDKVASLEDLQKRLKRKAKFKEVNFQDKCEGNNSLGDLLLKYAAEDDNSRVKGFLITNGFKLSQQGQVAAATNEEEEQKTPDIAENKVETSSADSSNSRDAQFTMSYDKIKEIVANNPDITTEGFKKELKEKNIKRVRKDHYTLLGYAVDSKGPNITHNTHDRTIFLQIIKLLANLKTKVDTATENKHLKTGLSEAIRTKQADVIEILLNSGKFNEKEKLDALIFAIMTEYTQGVKLLLGHVSNENMQAALKVTMNKEQTVQIQEITQVLLDFITSETPSVKENKPVPPIPTKKTNVGSTTASSDDNNSHCFTNAQFSPPNEEETKYKESKENFHISLRNDVVGVVITGLLIAAAVMVPSVAGAVVCGIVAALVAIAAGLHVKNSTLPSYKEMEKNRVEHVVDCTKVVT